MKKNPKPPAETVPPEKSPFEKMRDLARRVVNVPKSELPKTRRKPHQP